MGRFVIWIGRIPVWVWLFLAATQVLTLVAAPHRLSRLEKALQRMAGDPASAKVRERFEVSRREERFQLAAAATLAPTFLGLALWRWSRSRSETTSAV